MSAINGTETIDEVQGYLACIAESERDPDVQGYAVRLSTFVANLCLAILMTWSSKDIEESVYVIFMQVYTILIATFISLARQKLSVADAHFAMDITVSPLSIYLCYSTFRWFLRKQSALYARVGKSGKIVAFLTVLLFVQWFALKMIVYFAPSKVFEGERCASPSFLGWIVYSFVSTTYSLDYTIYFMPIFPLFYILYSIRHFNDIRKEHRRHQKKVQRWKFFRFVQVPFSWLRTWILSNWIVVTYAHQWLIFLIVFMAYLTYAGTVGAWIPDMGRHWNWVLQFLSDPEPVPEYVPDSDFDPLGFGQLLAATVAIQPLYEVLKLALRRRHDILASIKQYPRSLWNGVVFLTTGNRNYWRTNIEPRREDMRRTTGSSFSHALPMHTKQDGYDLAAKEEEVYPMQTGQKKRFDSDGSSYNFEQDESQLPLYPTRPPPRRESSSGTTHEYTYPPGLLLDGRRTEEPEGYKDVSWRTGSY